jgi:hypothetical protein
MLRGCEPNNNSNNNSNNNNNNNNNSKKVVMSKPYQYRPGQFKSGVTGLVYSFDEKDPVAKRAAKGSMDHDDQVATNAAMERQARVPPDTRSDGQKAREEAVLTGQPQVDVEVGIASRLDYLRARLPFLRLGDRAQAERRIAQLERLQAEKQAMREAKEARAALESSPEVQKALADAAELVESWQYRGDVSESIVVASRAALEQLRETLNVAEWRETAASLRAEHNQDRNRQIAELRAQQEVLQSQLVAVRADKSPAPTETPDG